MKPSQGNPPRRPRTSRREIGRLNAQRIARGITLEQVADEAAPTAKTKTCTVSTVSKALSGDAVNENVVGTLRRLLARDTQVA